MGEQSSKFDLFVNLHILHLILCDGRCIINNTGQARTDFVRVSGNSHYFNPSAALLLYQIYYSNTQLDETGYASRKGKTVIEKYTFAAKTAANPVVVAFQQKNTTEILKNIH